VSAGTLGCFVTNDGIHDLILSNNHVLANENQAAKGDPILQPGEFDGGTLADHVVGNLEKFVRLSKSNNRVDCAIASIHDGIEYYYNYLEKLGPIRGVRNSMLEPGETVYKVGRTTGYEAGRVSAIEVDHLKVTFDLGELTFSQQIEIAPTTSQPFSFGGDSGSLIVDSQNYAVGLLFAGNDVDVTFANDIKLVLKALDVKLVF
jgi:hypothetical protein